MNVPNQKPNHILEILGSTTYKRGSFNINKKPDLVIEMILNNMKIEGQGIQRQELIKLIDESNTSK